MSPRCSTSPLYKPFAFIPPNSSTSRSPCPALNALANHGYVARNGTNIPFWTLFSAIKHVYNLSFSLALLLTTVGYLTSGSISLFPAHSPHEKESRHSLWTIVLSHLIPRPTWTLDFASLCTQGPLKIAHDASLVHSDNTASCAPDPKLLTHLLRLAHHTPVPGLRTASPPSPRERDGLTLADLGRLHAAREAAQPHALNTLHEQVALGECGLAWCVMREHSADDSPSKGGDSERGVIPAKALEQWFGEERLPEGWWGVSGGRPVRTVGLREAGKRAKEVGLYHICA
ncbi:hypothetical protein FPV67DRAFT_1503095 [Lyophyllum atratum]|nr:hypothetical protein FPV67DRAFT_1503095 [Lyophyllum atratum]